MVGVDGAHPIFAGRLGGECGGRARIDRIDSAVRSYLLFGDLSVGRDAGYRGVVWKEEKEKSYSFSPARSWLRYRGVVLFVGALLAGIGSLVALLAPYSAYGRIAQNLLAPLWALGNNGLAYLAERFDSYAFYEAEVWVRSVPTFLVAGVTFVVLAFLAWRNGRTYCNTICPVGTVLGFLARYAWFRPEIDPQKCNSCTLCSRRCKAACIDIEAHRIDYSRCVTCMDCLDTCRQGAIIYRRRRRSPRAIGTQKTTHASDHRSSVETRPSVDRFTVDRGRRSFLTALGLWLGSSVVKAQEKKVDGGLAVILDKKIPARATPIVPPWIPEPTPFDDPLYRVSIVCGGVSE